MSASVLVLGSANMDLVVRSQRLPRPGETVIGGGFFQAPGGKGANQAVAAARLGAGRVSLIGAVGRDGFGQELRQGLKSEGIDTTLLLDANHAATGVAVILVDAHGENAISVASGANALVSAETVESISDDIFLSASVFLASLEVPLPTVAAGLKRAKAAGCRTILNPAPVPLDKTDLLRDALANVDVLVPNKVELEMLGDVIVPHLVVTLGGEGCEVRSEGRNTKISAKTVDAIDATAGGDCFCGALAAQLANGEDLLAACYFANKAASMAVSRLGAQPSIPTLKEFET